MPKTPAAKKPNKTGKYCAKLRAKHTKQRMRVKGELRKRRAGGRLRR